MGTRKGRSRAEKWRVSALQRLDMQFPLPRENENGQGAIGLLPALTSFLSQRERKKQLKN